MANTKEGSTGEMLAEKLRLMKVEQAEIKEAAMQQAKRDAIVEYGRKRSMQIEGRAVQDNPTNEGAPGRTFDQVPLYSIHGNMDSNHTWVGREPAQIL